ncbi:MAG: RHS repeat-associated core domain-containing protein [Bacteroidales bacterium]
MGGSESEQRYTAWGSSRYASGSTPTKEKYTGQLEAETGLYFYNARWYDPALGRFLQADVIVPDPYNVLDWDRYSYSRNNPIKYNDPTGHWVETVLDIGFIAYDIYDISANGLNWSSGLSLTADVACAVLPIATGGGAAVRAVFKTGEAADKVIGTVKVIDKADGALDFVSHGDELVNLVDHADDVEDFIRAVPVDQVGTSQPFKLRKGEDGLSVFEKVSPEDVLAELPGGNVPNTTVRIPRSALPEGTQVFRTPAPGLSERLSEGHRILVRPEGWSVDRFAKELKKAVGW